MRYRTAVFNAVALALILIIAACSAQAATSQDSLTDAATATATERATPRATPTVRPTPRPTPVPTPLPTPTPAPATFDAQLAAAETITYDELFRNAEAHIGTNYYFRGELIQVLGEPGEWQYRINVTPTSYGGYTDTILVTYEGMDRYLEDDIVDVVGMSGGPFTYESVLGGDITVPLLFIDANGMRLVP